MNPYVVERMAETRRDELVALADAQHVASRYRRARRDQAVAADEAVRAWRLAVGRGLVSAGLRLGLPPQRRTTARHDAHALLDGDDLVTRGPSAVC